MGDLLQHTQILETVHCWCGAPMAIPADLLKQRRADGQPIWCPATGHTFVFGESDNDRLRKRLESANARNTALNDQLRASERQTAAAKGQVTKMKNRAKAGVCPCCKRSFVQLARHMATKHPDFDSHA